MTASTAPIGVRGTRAGTDPRRPAGKGHAAHTSGLKPLIVVQFVIIVVNISKLCIHRRNPAMLRNTLLLSVCCILLCAAPGLAQGQKEKGLELINHLEA